MTKLKTNHTQRSSLWGFFFIKPSKILSASFQNWRTFPYHNKIKERLALAAGEGNKVISVKLSRILETEDMKKSIVIRDRSHNEIWVRGVDEALTLPAELMDQRVVSYECPDSEAYPIQITVAGSMEGIRKYRADNTKREWGNKNEKRR